MERADCGRPGIKAEVAFWCLLLATIALTHFGQPGIFQRQLIDHDDIQLIAPLQNISLAVYLRDWLPDRSHYAFPLTDLTFRVDFALERLAGVKTFWLVNLALFFAGLFFLSAIFRLHLRSDSWLRRALVAVVAFHPLNVEILQWAFQRKTLLVYALVSAGSFVVLRAAKEGRPAGGKEWAAVWGIYLASLLCFPSAVLWIFWALWMLRPPSPGQAAFRRMLAAAGALSAGYLAWLLSARDGWGQGLAVGGFHPSYLALGLGRGAWNLLFPFWLAPYFSTRNPLNLAGLLVIAAGAAAAWRGRRKLTEELPLFALAAALFVPSWLNVLTYEEFSWADRYLFLPLPFFALALAGPLVGAPQRTRRRASALAALFCLTGAFSVRAYAPAWRDDAALMQTCALTERSDKCLALALEKSFPRTGCQGARPALALAEERAKLGLPKTSPHLRDVLPFFLYLCTMQDFDTRLGERLLKLDSLPGELKVRGLVEFSKILAFVEMGKPDTALEAAESVYLGSAPDYLFTQGLVSLFHGQAMALCRIKPSPRCTGELKGFNNRLARFPVIEWIDQAGFDATLQAASKAPGKNHPSR